MKKIFCISLTVIISITTVGFRACFDVDTFEPGEFLWYNLNQRSYSGSDKSEEIYGIVVGANGSIGTSVGRPPNQWIMRSSGTTQNLNGLKGLNSSDSTIAYTVGNQGVILRTSDRGHNWIIIRAPNQNLANLNGVDIIPPVAPLDAVGYINIIVAGDLGTVFKSSNSGGNWSWVNLSINTTKKLNSIAIVNSFVFAVVGDSGAIYRTLDGGANWENRSISSSISLNKIVSTRYDRYCAVGTNGSIYTSTDYGYSWLPRSSGTTRTFRDVMFSGIDSGCAAGDFGTVRLTTNGGLTWYSDSYLNGLTTRNILSIAQVDDNTCNSITTSSVPGDNAADTTFFLAVSSEPFIGIEPISNFIAELFSLKQNYPNPFNPETKIRFDIPAGVQYIEPVQLIVYDILGKEVIALVNEQLKPGQYEIEWDASNYPSGAYFYKLMAGDFIETKKMVLVK